MNRDYRVLEARVRELERQLSRTSDPRKRDEQTPRLAMTYDDGGTPYPTSGSTFPIIFLDGHFPKANESLAVFTSRSNLRATWVHEIGGQFIAPNTVVEVWRQRGLGPAGSGEWWTSLGGTGASLVWYRVASGKRIDPGGYAPAYKQSWNNNLEIYYTADTSDDNTFDVYDVADSNGYFGQNFVLPGELVPAMTSATSGRVEIVGSRGIRREGIVAESQGIERNAFGKVDIRANGQLVPGPEQVDAHWDFISGKTIRQGKQVIVEYWPDKAQWQVVDREC